MILADEELERIKSLLAGDVFLVIDESELRGLRYLNVLVISMDDPQVAYLISATQIADSPTATTIIHAIDDTMRKLATERHNFLLLLSDVASYMIAAGKGLKPLYPNLFHVTCVAHLLHNCAMHVRAHYPSVDNLVSCVKACVVRNHSRRALFQPLGYPPEPIVTRWGSWLEAALYYCEHLPQVRDIVNNFKSDGVLVRNAKAAVNDESLTRDLVQIKHCYSSLVSLLEKVECSAYTIQEAHANLTGLTFGDDVCNLRAHLDKRLQKNELSDIVHFKRADVSPAIYSKLLSAQCTSVSVERSFSMLKKLLAKDRNFLPENVGKYFMLYFNLSSK